MIRQSFLATVGYIDKDLDIKLFPQPEIKALPNFQ
jgi:hypothetical protein